MRIFKRADALNQYLSIRRSAGETIGFAPTMGALHAGHMALIEACRQRSAITVCSIFINPTQFNNPDDFRHYPVTLEKDLEALLKAGCNVLFLPAEAEIYPDGYQKPHYDLGALETLLEGAFRPGHFQGVCQVVDRLLQIVLPNDLHMGQKDFQQCMVVKKMLELTTRTDVNLHITPTLRESDGLAMSSRNLRLNETARQQAPAIHQALQWIQQNLGTQSVESLEQQATDQLASKGFAVDYVTIRSAENLSPVTDDTKPKVALVAASVGGIRLIDNLPLY